MTKTNNGIATRENSHIFSDLILRNRAPFMSYNAPRELDVPWIENLQWETGPANWVNSPEGGYASRTNKMLALTSANGAITSAAFFREECLWGRWRKIVVESLVGGTRSIDQVSPFFRHSSNRLLIEILNWEGQQFVGDGRYSIKVSPYTGSWDAELPETFTGYLASLGKTTRKHLPYYVRRIQRDWGKEFEKIVLQDKEISEEIFDQVVELNRNRMKNKRTLSLWSPAVTKKRYDLAKKIGILVGIKKSGKLEAGTICYLHNGECNLLMVAHNPTYDQLNLGNAVLLLTVEEIIAKRCSKFHMSVGDYLYKSQFGGKRSQLYRVIIFRNSIVHLIWSVTYFFSENYQLLRRILGRLKRAAREILRASTLRH